MEYHINMSDIKKYDILKQVIKKEIKAVEAAAILGYHQVHISRLKAKLLNSDGQITAILRPKLPSMKKVPLRIKEHICKLRKEIYYDFNVMHFLDKLKERHNINYSYETIRCMLIEYGLHISRKKKKVHRRRRRMPKAGLLIQIDSSEHNWLPFIKKKWHLTATIDDADSKVPFAKFFSSDGVFNNMEVIRKTIEKEGLFAALYADKASHFTTTRYGGLHVNVALEQDDTQIERSLQELDITFIPANSPQAKGRIERLFRTFQDRLIKELRLHKIKNYSQANKFLQDYFINYYNKRFAKIEGVENAYKSLPVNINLDFMLCKKYSRKVNFDNTIQFEGRIIQIPPSKYRLSFAKCIVEVCLLENDSISILYKNQLIHTTELSKNAKITRWKKNVKDILDQRTYELCSV